MLKSFKKMPAESTNEFLFVKTDISTQIQGFSYTNLLSMSINLFFASLALSVIIIFLSGQRHKQLNILILI